MSFFGGILGQVAGGLIGKAFGDDAQDDQHDFASQQAADSRGFNSAEAQKQRDWMQFMTEQRYPMEVNSLRAAGLNPILAAYRGAPGAPSGASASTSPAGAGTAPRHLYDTPAAIQSASQTAVNEQIEKRVEAETEKIRAEKTEIEARTPTHAASIDRMRQQINESIEQVKKIQQDTSTSYFSAANLQQQTINLQATLPQIRATIDNLKALTKLHGAQFGKTEAEISEIRQRVEQNLPRLEAIVRDLEGQARKLEIPGRENQAGAAQSFWGSLGAYLREINPLRQILGTAK